MQRASFQARRWARFVALAYTAGCLLLAVATIILKVTQ